MSTPPLPLVSAGKLKGRKLHVPAGARPITSRAKHSLFDSLGDVTNLKVLDLYAGSGSLGIEALSRGAALVVFVDSSKEACGVISHNLSALGVDQQAMVYCKNISEFWSANTIKFDLVFADPPFDSLNSRYLAKLIEHIAIESFLVLKLPARFKFELDIPSPIVVEKRVLGNIALWYLYTPK